MAASNWSPAGDGMNDLLKLAIEGLWRAGT